MSLFASNIGSSSLIGLSGSGAAAGIAVSGYEINVRTALVQKIKKVAFGENEIL